MQTRTNRNRQWVDGEWARLRLQIHPKHWEKWLKRNLLPYHYRHFGEGDVLIWWEALIPHLILKMIRERKPLKAIASAIGITRRELEALIKAASVRTLKRINMQQSQVKPRGLR